MRRLRHWRLLAAVLGLVLTTANPGSVLAHAVAHHREDQQAHSHVISLEAHDGPAELSTREHAGSHQHVRLHQTSRTATQHLVLGPPVNVAAADLGLAPSERVADVSPSSFPAPDPPGDDPPRLRAPPLL